MTKFFVDDQGVYLGGFDGAEPPVGAIGVLDPPEHAEDIWNGGSFDRTLANLQKEVRRDRDLILINDVDPYQKVLAYNDLTPAQQAQLAQYRRDLLDLPQRPGFAANPKAEVFPNKPGWM